MGSPWSPGSRGTGAPLRHGALERHLVEDVADGLVVAHGRRRAQGRVGRQGDGDRREEGATSAGHCSGSRGISFW